MPSQGTSTFDLFALRFHFLAPKPIHFPHGETANLFRGQFGKILHRTDQAAYTRIFAPVRETAVPSGLHDPPRPFVLRVQHLDGAVVDRFLVGLNLFETHSLEPVRAAMVSLVSKRFGAEFVRVNGEELARLPLYPALHTSRVRITFLSPTELKNSPKPEFGQLFARIRDRISTLRALYGAGPLDIDFRAMGERASSIRMTDCDIQYLDGERVSGAGRHPLGGFVGFADYEGELTEFIPYLEIASYTGVGRQTVWGKGHIIVQTF
jgi:CRISPR-associated endoribonuclease Cas6